MRVPANPVPVVTAPIRREPATSNQIANQIQRAKEPLTNQVPEAVIRSNPKKPLFQINGISNPYLNYHSKIVEKRRQQIQQKVVSRSKTSQNRYISAIFKEGRT